MENKKQRDENKNKQHNEQNELSPHIFKLNNRFTQYRKVRWEMFKDTLHRF